MGRTAQANRPSVSTRKQPGLPTAQVCVIGT